MNKALKVIAGAPDRPLIIGDIEIPCYVLEGETRVLSQRGLQSGVGLGVGGGKQKIGAPRIAEFIDALTGKGINTKGLAARLNSAVEFQPVGGGRTAYAYPATLLVDLCDIVLEARDAGVLHARQAHIAQRADTLIRGLATVGIIGLVDEATGYQDIRSKRALEHFPIHSSSEYPELSEEVGCIRLERIQFEGVISAMASPEVIDGSERPTLRRMALSLAKACSMGLRVGLNKAAGSRRGVAPAASIASCDAGDLVSRQRLSMMT